MSGKDLVQIDLADAGGLGQRRLGGVPGLEQCLQRLGQVARAEAGGVFRENAIQIVGTHQLVQKLVCVFSIMRSRPSYFFVSYFNQYSWEKQYAGCIVLRFFAPQRGEILYRYAANRYTNEERKGGGRSCTIR